MCRFTGVAKVFQPLHNLHLPFQWQAKITLPFLGGLRRWRFGKDPDTHSHWEACEANGVDAKDVWADWNCQMSSQGRNCGSECTGMIKNSLISERCHSQQFWNDSVYFAVGRLSLYGPSRWHNVPRLCHPLGSDWWGTGSQGLESSGWVRNFSLDRWNRQSITTDINGQLHKQSIMYQINFGPICCHLPMSTKLILLWYLLGNW